LDDIPVGALEDEEDEEHLRECLLRFRLNTLLRDLVAPHARRQAGHRQCRLGEFQETESTLCAVLAAAGTSCQSEYDAALSPREKFDGDLKREKEGMQDFTSLALFVDDVERLLRDLYCDFETQAADSVRYAVFSVMRTCTKRSPKSIWQEHGDAETLDYGWYGIGLAFGDGINTNEWLRAEEAATKIAHRARTVRANRSAFSKYTVRFVRALDEHWPELRQRKRGAIKSRKRASR
jgi:hypothetical protein